MERIRGTFRVRNEAEDVIEAMLVGTAVEGVELVEVVLPLTLPGVVMFGIGVLDEALL